MIRHKKFFEKMRAKCWQQPFEMEVSDFIKQHGSLKNGEGELAVIRNAYLPPRSIQTELGNIEAKVPKVRDRCSRVSSLIVT
jgi:hypothetical protein